MENCTITIRHYRKLIILATLSVLGVFLGLPYYAKVFPPLVVIIPFLINLIVGLVHIKFSPKLKYQGLIHVFVLMMLPLSMYIMDGAIQKEQIIIFFALFSGYFSSFFVFEQQFKILLLKFGITIIGYFFFLFVYSKIYHKIITFIF